MDRRDAEPLQRRSAAQARKCRCETIHTYKQRFGFRTFEVRDGDGLYLNGRKIILKGVNRHSFWPDSGRCLSEAVHRLDIETIKDMNGNAVRMSHYPPDVEFLALCDELGLYVLNELAGWHNQYDTDIGRSWWRQW
jgi:beta-galactosidase/beta-glucuronidase